MGVELRSETDTEVLAHLVSRAGGDDLGRAVIEALAQVEGTYGLAVLDARWPDRIVVARRGSPVVIGVGDGEHFVASDMAALVPFVDQVLHLDEGEVGIITASRYVSFDGGRCPTAGRLQLITGDATSYEKGGFAHFMRKEIAEQPEAVART